MAAAAPQKTTTKAPRYFTAAYKAKIVTAYDAAAADGAKAALLRRERLSTSHIGHWRKAMATGTLTASSDLPRSAVQAANADESEIAVLRQENARLNARLIEGPGATEAALTAVRQENARLSAMMVEIRDNIVEYANLIVQATSPVPVAAGPARPRRTGKAGK